MNRKVRTALYACALMAPLILQSCNAQSEKKESNKECTEETNKNTEKKVMTTGSENFIFAEGKEWEPAGEGVVRQIMGYNDDIMVVKVKFEKGAVGAVHHHVHSQVTYVESGKFEFTINGVKKIVSAGDCLYKEPDAVHGCVCLEPGMLIDCFSPMRADFLEGQIAVLSGPLMCSYSGNGCCLFNLQNGWDDCLTLSNPVNHNISKHRTTH